MPKYTYVYYRQLARDTRDYDTLEAALHGVLADLENESAWPEEILEDGIVIHANKGAPWQDSCCQLNDFVREWGNKNNA